MHSGPPLPSSLLDRLQTLLGGIAPLVRAVAFWSAVAFPAVYAGGYLAILALPDLSVPSAPVLGALLAGNVLALVVGHRHDGLLDAAASGPDSSPTGRVRRGD